MHAPSETCASKSIVITEVDICFSKQLRLLAKSPGGLDSDGSLRLDGSDQGQTSGLQQIAEKDSSYDIDRLRAVS